MKNVTRLCVLYLVTSILLFPATLFSQAGDQVEGLWDSVFGDPARGGHGMAAAVNAVAVHPLTGDLYAAGNFWNAGSVQVNYIARWDGSQWHPLGGGVNDQVNAIVITPDGMLYVGGRFTQAVQPGGSVLPVSHIAMWDGGQWSPIGQGVDGRVNALALDNQSGDIYIGGDSFSNGINTDGTSVYSAKIIRWDGGQWQPLGLGLLFRWRRIYCRTSRKRECGDGRYRKF
jgi:hypothetical protein